MNNFRDLGCSGIRKGKVFRGAEYSVLTKEDQALLFDHYGIKTVIDLRSPQELEEKKDVEVTGVEVINVPLLTIEEMSEMVQGQFPNVLASYRKAVNKQKKNVWSRIFDIFLNNDGPILFHCSQGKDRTGIVAAIFLRALGIDQEKVIQDYLKTNESASMPAEYRQFAETLPPDIRKLFNGLFYVDQDFLKEAFREIDKQFGSLDGFLAENCSLNKEKRKALLDKYVGRE